MPATFNEFQRELAKLEIDPKLKYVLTMLYERFGQLLTEHQQIAQVQVELANSMQAIVGLHEVTQKRVLQIARGQRMEDGVDVQSVANKPEH